MRTFIKTLGLCAILALAIPAYSQVSIGIQLGAPPPPRHEIIVARPYAEAVWAPGYYRYEPRAAHYIWMPGAWRGPRERVVREDRREYRGHEASERRR